MMDELRVRKNTRVWDNEEYVISTTA